MLVFFLFVECNLYVRPPGITMYGRKKREGNSGLVSHMGKEGNMCNCHFGDQNCNQPAYVAGGVGSARGQLV